MLNVYPYITDILVAQIQNGDIHVLLKDFFDTIDIKTKSN